MKKINLLAILALAATPAFLHAQTTSYSSVVGYSSSNLSAGQYIYSPTFVKASLFQGSGIVSSGTLPVSGISTASLSPTAYSDGRPNYPRSYVEILSGSSSGVSYDITSVSANSVTVADLPASLNGTTVQFVIRPHVTLADIFTATTGFGEYSDAIAIYNSDGTIALRYLAGGVVTLDDFTTEAGHTPIYPGNGVILNVSGPVSLTATGEVKASITRVPVYPGVNNVVGTLNPSSGLNATSSNLATSLSAYSDAATIYSNDGSFALSSILYSDGASVTDDTFTPFTTANSPVLPVGGGMIVNVAAPGFIDLNSPLAP